MIKRNDANAVKQFIEMPQYRDIIDNIVDSNEGLPIITACNIGNVEIVDALIKAGAYVNSIEDRSYETPIYIAAKNENLGVISFTGLIF